MLSICLLISGGLGFRILDVIFRSSYRISAVFTDRKSSSIIRFCEKNQILLFIGNPRKGNAEGFIMNIESDVLLSVNYLFLIEKDLINHPKRYAVNLHGSILPKYRGRTPHVWAIINGENTSGITAHIIDEGLDNGDIIEQIEIPIDYFDTGADLLNKFNTLYPKMVKGILRNILDEKIYVKKQDRSQATYFGKRTPEDGHICWSWSKERIRNWIRAQARPYPGAFTFYKDMKIIIHNAIFDDLGFHYSNDENGKILKITSDGIYVKAANGCLYLSELEVQDDIRLKKGYILV